MNQSNEHEDFMHKMREALKGIKASERKFEKLNSDFRNELVENFGLSETTITSNDLIMDMVNFNKVDLWYLMKFNNQFYKENKHTQDQILHSQQAMIAIINIKWILKVQQWQEALIRSLWNKWIIKDSTSYIFYDNLLDEIKKVSENTPLFHEELMEILEQKIFDKNTLIELERICDSILVYTHYNSQKNIDKAYTSLQNYMKHLKKKISSDIASN